MTEPTLASYLGDMSRLFAAVYSQIKSGVPGGGGVEAVGQIRSQLQAFDAAARARETAIGSIVDTASGLKHLGELLSAADLAQNRGPAIAVAESAENDLRQYLGIAFEVDSGNKYIELNF